LSADQPTSKSALTAYSVLADVGLQLFERWQAVKQKLGGALRQPFAGKYVVVRQCHVALPHIGLWELISGGDVPAGSDELSRITNGSGSASASCGCTCIIQEP
jgi:hypothetical protein